MMTRLHCYCCRPGLRRLCAAEEVAPAVARCQVLAAGGTARAPVRPTRNDKFMYPENTEDL